MSKYKPEIEEIIEKALNNLEETMEVKLTEEQKMIFIFGFSAGLTTLKNFPEFSESYISELFIKMQLSKNLNEKAKKWSENNLYKE